MIHAELDRQQELLTVRAASFDTRSGLLLATAGILIGFQASHPSVIGAIAATIAIGSGACTAMAMRPAKGPEIKVREMRANRIHRPPKETLLVLVDTRLSILEEDEARLNDRFAWLQRGIKLLGMAALVLAIGILHDTGLLPTDHADTTPRPPTSNTSPRTTAPATSGTTRSVNTKGSYEHPNTASPASPGSATDHA